MFNTTTNPNLKIKRWFDIVVSAASLLFLAGPLLIISALIKLTDHGPILYGATRVGLNGRIFKVYKFRSMVVNADKIGPSVTAGDDPRITKIGRILRKTKLDELPQLWNVLRGDMSLVGPRPEAPCYVVHYTDEQRKILSVRPGITGAAQIEYRHEEEMLAGAGDRREEIYINEIMPAKAEIDLKYVKNITLFRDIQIIVNTAKAL